MISNNMLEHIRKSIEEGELLPAHVPVVTQLLESFNEQTAEIVRLNSQLATTWQPVPDGDAITPKRSLYKGLGVDGDRLYITQTNGAKDSIYLPRKLRLCEKVQP